MSGTTEPRTLLDFLDLARGFLAGKKIAESRLDAEVLLADTLGISRLELYTNYERPLTKPEVDRYRETLQRRASREPVSYITGKREFWSLDFHVDRRVLIPRPETETLVETALELLRAAGAAPLRAADIGTGSGAVAVALAKEIPDLYVLATDRSAASLEVAPLNARVHGVEGRVEFAEGNAAEPLAEREPFDLVVSNPPYIKKGEMGSLEPEVREWEPSTALVSGDDGMETTRAIIDGTAPCLRAQGWLLLEVGTQAAEVTDYLQTNKWREVSMRRDLAGRERVAVARRPA